MQSLRRHTLFLVLVFAMVISGITAAYCYDVASPYKDLASATTFIDQGSLEDKLHYHEEFSPELTFELLTAATYPSSPVIQYTHPDRLSLILPNVFFEIFVPPQKAFNSRFNASLL